MDIEPTTQVGLKDREGVLWPRIRRIVALADAIAKRADKLATERPDADATPKSRSNSSESVNEQMPATEETKRLLDHLGVGLVCTENLGGKERWGPFWELFRAIVREQLGGLFFHTSRTEKYLENSESSLWKPDPPEKNPWTTARWCCFALCLYEIRKSVVSTSKQEAQGSTVIEKLEKWIEALPNPPLPDSARLAQDKRVSSEALHMAEARLLFDRLTKKPQGEQGEDTSITEEQKSALEQERQAAEERQLVLMEQRLQLVRELEACVSQSIEEAKPFRISLLLRILGGRYPNKAQRNVSVPSNDLDSGVWGDKRAMENGLRFVLKCQNENGSWPTRVFARRDPLLHDYSPLLHVLDLETPVLMRHIEGLLEAAERALNAIAPKLDAVENSLERNEFSNAKNDTQFQSMLCALIEGLSVGTMVVDRFKDLLSDSILQSLGATTVDRDMGIDSIAEALSLQGNLDAGVIEQWRVNSERRPGAILLYGPPGTGKSTIARVLAETLNKKTKFGPGRDWKFVEFTPADFARKGTDGIVAQAERLFKLLMDVRRCVVLLDEMEEFIRARGKDADKTSRLITAAFLPLLEKVAKSRELVLVVATNFVGTVDAAITRPGRFDLILPTGPPDGEWREKHFRKCVKKWIAGGATLSSSKEENRAFKEVLNRDRSRWDVECAPCVAEYTMGYSISELKTVFEEIVKAAYPKNIVDLAYEDNVLVCENIVLASRASFENLVWEIRTRRTPLALSGRSGSSWRAFVDEAARFSRTAPGGEITQKTLADYMEEPSLPKPETRMGDPITD